MPNCKWTIANLLEDDAEIYYGSRMLFWKDEKYEVHSIPGYLHAPKWQGVDLNEAITELYNQDGE